MSTLHRLLGLTAMLCAAGTLAAQTTYNVGGAVLDHDIIAPSSILSLSQRHSLGTARTMAMGGAFTSLGADIGSIAINPAGLGMYRHSDVSMTVSVGIDKAKTAGSYGYNNSDNTNTRFSINNLGASVMVYEGKGKILAVNLGLSYNKVADFNYSASFSMPANAGSLADCFADMANGGGLLLNTTPEKSFISDGMGNANYQMNPYYWGTVLGYKCGLINNLGTGWLPDEIGNGASIDHFYSLDSRGAAAEYSIAAAANYNNIIYFGASLDIQSIFREQSIFYGEEILYPAGAPSGSELPYQLNYFNYNQTTRLNGAGIGAKFGITVRPIESLRIGVAVHTPTYYSLSYRYAAQMSSRAYSAGSNPADYDLVGGHIYSDEITPELLDNGEYRWEFATPTRLLAGVSYTISKMAIVSVDYQYDAYAGIRMIGSPYGTEEYNDMFRTTLRGSHTVRGGVEVKPIPMLALRVGGGYTDRMVAQHDTIFSHPVTQSSWYCAAGVGIMLSKNVYLDVAYSYRSDDDTPYRLYYSVSDKGTANQSNMFDTSYTRHNVALTMGVRF